MNDDDMEPLLLRETMTEMSMPTLTVHVDFNDLLNDFEEGKAFELVGKLKDLLA